MMLIRKTCSGTKSGGFTLLEILVAIMIFAVIITTVYQSLRAVLSKNEAINHGADIFEMGRTCLNRMVLDLTGLYVESRPLFKPPGFTDPPDPYRFAGEASYVGAKNFSRLRFASTAHLPMAGSTEKGIAEIVYYVKETEDPESAYVLKRADTICPYDEDYRFEEKDSDPILCRQVEGFTLIYFDAEGEAHEEWDSDTDGQDYATPRMVEIRLQLKQNTEIHSFYTKMELPVYRESTEDSQK
jgi:general secretion pathway protein J